MRPSSLHKLISLSSDRATSKRLCPRSASLRANTSPIPEDAPVMSVVFIEFNLAPSGATENSPAIHRTESILKGPPSPVGTKESIKHPFFIRNSMLIKKSDQFIFEGMSLVMFFLRLNIPYCVVQARD